MTADRSDRPPPMTGSASEGRTCRPNPTRLMSIQRSASTAGYWCWTEDVCTPASSHRVLAVPVTSVQAGIASGSVLPVVVVFLSSLSLISSFV